jgi:hypothetical protein
MHRLAQPLSHGARASKLWFGVVCDRHRRIARYPRASRDLRNPGLQSSPLLERLSRINQIHARIVLIIVAAMASLNPFTQTAVRGSVTAVLQLVNIELQQLLVRREEVAKRIRSVCTAVNALQEFAANPAPNSAAAASRAMKGERSARRSLRQNSTELFDDASPRLRRACRIALLETDEPLSEQEICARILRRGSFSFVDAGSAYLAILKELTAMAEAGEVRHPLSDSNNGSSDGWQRISGEEDLARG